MKIAIVTSGSLPIPPVHGGAVENLVDIFIKHNEMTEEHEILIISNSSQKAEILSEQYRNTRFEFINTGSLIYKLSKLIRYIINRIPNVYIGNAFVTQAKKRLIKHNKSYDVIIVENVPLYGLALRKVIKDRMILHLHNDTLSKGVKLSKRILDSYDKVLCVSKYIEKRVSSIYKDNKIQVLYNGIDTSNFNKSHYVNMRHNLREKYNIESDDIVIMYTGRIHKDKGVIQLIQAFKKLIKEIHNVKLLIVGGEPVKSNKKIDLYNNFSKEIKDKTIITTGYVDYSKMPEYYAVGDIGVVPSVGKEAFALSALEHLSTGNPVIATDSGGLPEVVNSDCGFILRHDDENLVDSLFETLLKLCKDRNKIKLMGINSRIRSELFDFNIYCDKFNTLIK